MITPLPEPEVKLHGKHKNGKTSAESIELYTTEQMIEHEADGFKRGIEAAANLIEDFPYWVGKMAKLEISTAIRKLGEAK